MEFPWVLCGLAVVCFLFVVFIIYISNIVTIHYIELPKDYIGYQDNHDFWEICYLDKGDILVNYDGKEILQEQGELFFIEPNKEHSHWADGAVAPNLFVISFDCRSASMKHFINKTIEASGAVKKILKKLISESRQAFYMPICEPSLSIMKSKPNPPIGSKQLIKNYLEELLIMLLRDMNSIKYENPVHLSNSLFDNDIVNEIIDYLKKNIHTGIKISDVCVHLCYGKSYLSRIFHNYTGYTIIQYYNILKISLAKTLIRESRGNFSQISNTLGYDNPYYFSKKFKQIAGMTPSEYLKSVSSH